MEDLQDLPNMWTDNQGIKDHGSSTAAHCTAMHSHKSSSNCLYSKVYSKRNQYLYTDWIRPLAVSGYGRLMADGDYWGLMGIIGD